ncbi:non-ribosomal peptide synthetase, partial [Salinispora oceanensis]
YTRLLTLATGNPRRSLADHDLLTTNERRQLLRQGGGDPVDGPQPFVHELVMAQAARTPDAEAVRTETESLTYQELDRRAEAVSRSLRALGLGPENVVGVMVDRSPHLVTAMLAVLRTGAALLMIDLTYPAERIHRMLTLARADAVLAEPSPALAGVPDTVRVMDIDSGGTPPPGAARPAHRTLLAGNTACVVFTSGSTGEPKGAMITHAALTNTIVDGWRRLQLTASDTVGAVASPAFDVALFEILGALAHGARLVLLPREAASDGERLAEAVDRHHITVVDVTPTTASTLPERWHAPGLRLASGGEELSAELARSLTARLAGVWNVYGPAEATINTTVHRLRAPVAGDLVPLGRPVRGATVRVLSERAGLVPIGVPGELFIGGIGLSRGYVSRPALTAERFVPDPFGPPGARMYRTGDAAAWRPDGSLVFLGRRDQQVKVRGQRLETGEVEAALTRHPAVAHALVTAQGGQLDRRLAGYVVWRPGLTVPWADLRGFLRESLPEYMVPVVFTALERLPRTSSGKVDRRALPEIPLGPAGRTYAAPRDDIEELVASVWADVLGVDRVGRDDNFFELGGHSLRVARVVASLRKARDVELPLRALFERPVLSDFADLVRTRDGGPERTRIPRRPAGVTVPLSAVQRRLWFLHNLDPTRSDYNSYFLLSLSGAVEESAFSGALSRLVDRHEILRARIGGAADAPTLVVGSSGEFTLDSADVSHLPAAEAEAEARRLALRFAGVPFDLVAGPLVRGLLVRWGVRKWVFVLVA